MHFRCQGLPISVTSTNIIIVCKQTLQRFLHFQYKPNARVMETPSHSQYSNETFFNTRSITKYSIRLVSIDITQLEEHNSIYSTQLLLKRSRFAPTHNWLPYLRYSPVNKLTAQYKKLPFSLCQYIPE